jgi:hypothetical protein
VSAAHVPLPLPLQTSNGWLLLYSLHVSKEPVLPHSSSHWNGAEQLQALRAVDVYIKHPLRCEHSAPPSCLCCDSQSILVAYADGFLGSASWLGKVRRCCCCDAGTAAERLHASKHCTQHGKQGCLQPARCSASRAAKAQAAVV